MKAEKRRIQSVTLAMALLDLQKEVTPVALVSEGVLEGRLEAEAEVEAEAEGSATTPVGKPDVRDAEDGVGVDEDAPEVIPVSPPEDDAIGLRDVWSFAVIEPPVADTVTLSVDGSSSPTFPAANFTKLSNSILHRTSSSLALKSSSHLLLLGQQAFLAPRARLVQTTALGSSQAEAWSTKQLLEPVLYERLVGPRRRETELGVGMEIRTPHNTTLFLRRRRSGGSFVLCDNLCWDMSVEACEPKEEAGCGKLTAGGVAWCACLGIGASVGKGLGAYVASSKKLTGANATVIAGWESHLSRLAAQRRRQVDTVTRHRR